MCGRIANTMKPGCLREQFNEALAANVLDEPNLLPRYNLPPTGYLPGIRLNDDGQQQWEIFRWGLIPRWAKHDRIPDRTFNARCETAAEKPTFREAWKKRRCVLPISGYYEWTGPKSHKQPFYFHQKDASPLLLAGLWETWRHEDTVVETCTVLTQASVGKLSNYHHRMPVLLNHSETKAWLTGPTEMAQALIQKTRTDILDIHPVSKEVNNVRNDHPSLIEPIAFE